MPVLKGLSEVNMYGVRSDTIPPKKKKFSRAMILLYMLQELDTIKYSGPSKVEHNLFQEEVQLSICSTFELNFPIRNNVN
jgi:hypothetical protein